MEDAKQVWSWWQSLLANFGSVFTRPGWVRFAQWVTGMMLCDEEHTITQILVSLGLESRWRVLEHFAEYGAWDRVAVEQRTIQLTLLGLLQFRLEAAWGEGSYWLKPQWNRRKQHPSILDLRRLFWRHRATTASTPVS